MPALALSLFNYSSVYHGFDHVDSPSECVAWLRLWHLKRTHQPISAADFDAVLGHCEAVTDMPACVFAPELIAAYPDAKVIINHRAANPLLLPPPNALPRAVLLARAARGLDHARGPLPGPVWELPRYCEGGVSGALCAAGCGGSEEREERTLRWSVQKWWGPLCEFLGREGPVGEEFPRRNALDEVLERVMDSAVRDGEVTFWRMMGFFAVVVVGVEIAVVWVKWT